MRTRANSKHVLDAFVVNSTGKFFGNSNPTKSIEFSSVERARPFAATHMSNKLRRAIAVLDELASKDERQCIDRILTPAAAALPNRFEHEHDALTHIRATFGITVSECERASGSARDVFMFAVAKSLTGEELVKTLVENGSSALLASAAGGVWTAEGERAAKAVRAMPFGAPKVLTDLQWELRLPLTGSKQELVAGLDLELSKQNPCGKPTVETVDVEFDRAGLIDFFGKIEKIQSQLDSLV